MDDLINGMIKLMNGNHTGSINIGNSRELTILQLTELTRNAIDSSIEFIKIPLPKDDPLQRKLITNLAKLHLDWEPKVELEEGPTKTIQYFKGISNLSGKVKNANT